MKSALFVGLGGLFGTLFRYVLHAWQAPLYFPWSTLVTNILGSFLLGAITAWLLTCKGRPQWVKLGLGTGFCGGFTTMSTFAADFFALLQHVTVALVYVALSLVGGIVSAYVGMLIVLNAKRRQVSSE